MDQGAALGPSAEGMALGRPDRPRFSPRRPVLLGLALLACLGLALAAGLIIAEAVRSPHRSVLAATPRRYGLDGNATWAVGARPAPAITTLPDQNGHLFSLAALHGRTVAMVFFDSHCRQECPLEGHALAASERGLPAAERPVLVAVSVNPQDTRASVRAAVRSWGLAGLAPWYWLMGNRRMLAPVWRAYHIYVGKPVNGDIPHTEAVYLIDRKGYERSAYLYPFGTGFVTHDLRRLAASRA